MADTLKTLQRIAVVGTLIVGGLVAWDHAANQDPAHAAHQAAADAFEAGNWSRAHDLFSKLTEQNTSNLAARRGQANSLVQLARFKEAHTIMDDVVKADPDNACNHATRGIIADHLGQYDKAMRDYAHAVTGCRAAVHGMSWFQRLMSNTHEQPPTIASRLIYLRNQMELPSENRVLRIQDMDRVQKPWTS